MNVVHNNIMMHVLMTKYNLIAVFYKHDTKINWNSGVTTKTGDENRTSMDLLITN